MEHAIMQKLLEVSNIPACHCMQVTARHTNALDEVSLRTIKAMSVEALTALHT